MDFGIGQRMSVYQFSDEQLWLREFYYYDRPEDITTWMTYGVKFSAGHTATSDGMRKTCEDLQNHDEWHNSPKDKPQYLVVLTDGAPNEPAEVPIAAKECQDVGFTTIGFGLGQNAPQRALEDMASEPKADHVLNNIPYAEMATELKNMMENVACRGAVKTTTPEVKRTRATTTTTTTTTTTATTTTVPRCCHPPPCCFKRCCRGRKDPIWPKN